MKWGNKQIFLYFALSVWVLFTLLFYSKYPLPEEEPFYKHLIYPLLSANIVSTILFKAWSVTDFRQQVGHL